VHEHVTKAFEVESRRAGGPHSLYYMALPMHVFEEISRFMESQGVQIASDSIRESARNLEHLAPTTEIDVEAYIERKFTSMAEHRTQLPADSPFSRLPPELRRKVAGTEYFHRASPPHAEGNTEHGLWIG
jgi:LmbE family N-acetylglucosaminyl deacetylase